MNKLFIITGANGVGKTTLMNELKKDELLHMFLIHDFDERGVPDNADKNWRINETKYWLQYAQEQEMPVLLCGCIIPSEVVNLNTNDINRDIIFLKIDNSILRERITSRYQTVESTNELMRATGKTIEQFIYDNFKFNEFMENDAFIQGVIFVNTDHKLPKDLAGEIASVILV